MIKKWTRPRLIVLKRGAAEESVLLPCKGNGLVSAPGSSFNNCYSGEGDCHNISTS